MVYKKVEEEQEGYLLIYFVDSKNQKQGELFCYKTEGRLPMKENLLYVEEYRDGQLLHKSWELLPETLPV